MTDEALGPGFDTVTLTRPTPRKLVCLWMEQAGLRTVLLPTVWEQLAHPRRNRIGVNAASWRRMYTHGDAPFRWLELDDEQQEAVEDVLRHFTEPCFPRLVADQIPDDADANTIAEALVVGTDVLVTQDINSINHDEINFVIEKRLGANSGFVLTVDKALARAFPGGESAEHLLMLALATIAPPAPPAPGASANHEWAVEAAHQDFANLLRALAGANVSETAQRLDVRWRQCSDLERMLAGARMVAENSRALRFERMRAEWQREAAHGGRPIQGHKGRSP